jgi:uncharacterized protein (TIGR03382 family)
MAAVLFQAKSARAAELAVSGCNDGAVVGDEAAVVADATSDYVITSVVATIGTITKPVKPNTVEKFDISSLPLGPVNMKIEATDASGAKASQTCTPKHDHPPKLVVETLDGTVARPSLHIKASCSDSDPYPCTSLTASAAVLPGGKPLQGKKTAGGLAIDEVVDFSAADGDTLFLNIEATDSAGLKVSRELSVFAEMSPRLVPVGEVCGPIHDFDAKRILYRDEVSGLFSIKDRSTGAVTALGPVNSWPSGEPPTAPGYLTPDGAVWPWSQWRNGALESLSPPQPGYSNWADLRVSGTWAIWAASSSSSTMRIYRRNLVTGKTDSINPSYPSIGSLDVDEQGNYAYSSNNTADTSGEAVVFSSGGTIKQVGSAQRIGGVSTDSGNVVWYPRGLTYDVGYIDLWTPTGGETLEDAICSYLEPGPCPHYRMESGWIAYTKGSSPTADGRKSTVWTRSPTGVHALATPFDARLYVVGLNGSGEVAVDKVPFNNEVGQGQGRRYLSKAGPSAPTTPLEIGGAHGRAVFRDGSWYMVMGRSLFRVETGPLPQDAGVGPSAPPAGMPVCNAPPPPGSTPDAASSGSSGAAPNGDPANAGASEEEGGGACALAREHNAGAGGALALVALVGLVRRRRPLRHVAGA